MKAKTIRFIIIILFGTSLHAQVEDAEGCKDHVLFNRLQDFYIESCSNSYNIAEVEMSGENFVGQEGNVTRIHYVWGQDDISHLKSDFQIMKNYENAILAKGGKKIYMGSSATFQMNYNGKEIWVAINNFYSPQGSGISSYDLVVIEKEQMNQEVVVKEMLDELNKSGFIALYINFETGKSTIQTESQKIIDQMVELLKSNPSLKISIEGHTDNVGKESSNQTLSEERAKAVMDALVSKGIERSRLSSKGWGSTKPVADNRTEDGKAKNRRVEIVKL